MQAKARNFFIAAVILLLPGDLTAQSAQAISLQISGLYNVLFGDVFDNIQDGVGGEVQLRYTPGALSVGAGFQYTTHKRPERAIGEPAYIQLYGGFIEPRYRIHTGSNVVAPYVSARFSLLKAGFPDETSTLSSSFIQLNGGGGLLVRLGPRLNMDFGATLGYNRLGAGTLTIEVTPGNPVPKAVTASSGSNIVMRLGFALGIGG